MNDVSSRMTTGFLQKYHELHEQAPPLTALSLALSLSLSRSLSLSLPLSPSVSLLLSEKDNMCQLKLFCYSLHRLQDNLCQLELCW